MRLPQGVSRRDGDGAVAVGEQPLTTEAARPPRAGVLRHLFPWWAVVAPWLVSRVLSIGVMLAAIHDPFRGGRFTQLVLKWDGAYYVGIARTGYGPVDVRFPRWAFFPGLPGVIRVLRELGNDEVLVFALNQLVFLVALAGVYRIAQRYGSPRAALLAVWALALFPASFVFSMTYASSLFLAASVWAFVLVEEHHRPSCDVWAGVLAAGAAL
ncbi:MAG TPA: glycosyltransferase family 39 protein, partial [Acidimicrobiia bacterium]|nr:glycosyltransferase family 39 protein [Acidimicrobiia bacterium]